MKVMLILPEADFTSREKLPSKSVVVPLLVPTTITVAPGSGPFISESNTVPVRVP